VSGSGLGSKGSGLGSTLNTGSVLAPPTSGGSGAGSGIVASNQPGAKIGNPGASAGATAMSPSGSDKPGLGGSGGGTSIGHGSGPGSGMAGENLGAGKSGSGHGSDPSARGGISPSAGPGGAGHGTTGVPAVPGVSINGGSTIVTLPSFGTDGGGSNDVPARSSLHEQQGPAVTIVATSRSGGAFNFYGKLPGDNYTVYIDTTAGTVVMQFADPVSATHPYAGALTGPQGLRTDLPAGLPHMRMVVQCVLDASGNVKNARVLEPGSAVMTAKIMAALANWKFRPAFRGNQPIQVNAILGFGIDTNDRF
jgi:TonB family protein